MAGNNLFKGLAAIRTGQTIDTGASFEYSGGMRLSLLQKSLIITTMHGVVG